MYLAQPSLNNMRIYGAVLAGGGSTRMGTDKRFLKINEEYLVDRALRLVAQSISVDSKEVFLCGNVPERECILDTVSHLGPLGGVWSALKQVVSLAQNHTVYLLVVPVDMPLLTVAVLQQLTRNITEIEGDQFNSISYVDFELPFLLRCNSFTQDTLAAICESSNSSLRSIRAFQEAIGVNRIYLESESQQLMINANSPHDWNHVSMEIKV